MDETKIQKLLTANAAMLSYLRGKYGLTEDSKFNCEYFNKIAQIMKEIEKDLN